MSKSGTLMLRRNLSKWRETRIVSVRRGLYDKLQVALTTLHRVLWLVDSFNLHRHAARHALCLGGGRPFTPKSLLNLEFASRTEFRIMNRVGRDQATAVRLSRYENDEGEK